MTLQDPSIDLLNRKSAIDRLDQTATEHPAAPGEKAGHHASGQSSHEEEPTQSREPEVDEREQIGRAVDRQPEQVRGHHQRVKDRRFLREEKRAPHVMAIEPER